jgi:hypothetical protein
MTAAAKPDLTIVIELNFLTFVVKQAHRPRNLIGSISRNGDFNL